MEENTIKQESTLENKAVEPPCYDFPEEEPFELTKRDIIFCVSAAVSCILMVIFGLFGNFALGFTLSSLLLISVLGIYFRDAKSTRVTAVVCGALAAAGTVTFITTSNGSVRFFMAVEILLLCLVLFDSLVNHEKSGGTVLRILGAAKSAILNLPISVKSFFSKKDGNQNTLGKILVGVLCALPALFVIIPLLASSDTAFSGMMDTLVRNSIPTAAKTILGLIFATFVISYGLSLKKDKLRDIEAPEKREIESIYIISFLSAVSLAYLLYLFSQLAYFFSAFAAILPEGYEFTLSGYARRGFFELCAIAVINFIIVLSSILLSSKNGSPHAAVKALCTFISVFTLLISATAISKMVLYIDSFGMTVLRLTTSSFMVFLSIVFASLLLRIYIPKIKVIKTALFTAAAVLLILGTVNVNAVTAKYNYDRYVDKSLPHIDISAIADLGDEGVPYLVKLAESDDYTVNDLAKERLKQYYTRTYFNLNMEELKHDFNKETLDSNMNFKGIKYFSIPKYKAYKALYEYAENNTKSFRYSFL